jgi:hypothetical protein
VTCLPTGIRLTWIEDGNLSHDVKDAWEVGAN